jgi:hydroxypyruvate reductase
MIAPDAWTDERARRLLLDLLAVGIERGRPGATLARFLPERPRGRCVVVGAGKAAMGMAAAVEAAWPDVAVSGAVVVRHGERVALPRITVLEAPHPVPDASSEAAAQHMLALVAGLTPHDLVLALMSGGGSALMALPVEGVALADKQDVTAALLRSGAAIAEMNAVRRRLSAIKGGGLARAAYPARVVTLLVSDVPGDDPAVIASGPTIHAPGDDIDPVGVLDGYGIEVPPHVRDALARPALSPRTAMADDVRMIAAPIMSLRAIAEEASAAGIDVMLLGDAIEGEAREVAKAFAGIARAVRRHAAPVAPPVLLIAGGETTVTIAARSGGRGGRNSEYALSLAVALKGEPGIWALAADSDGIDGNGDAAGAIIGPDTLARMRSRGIDPLSALFAHDSYSAFDAVGDLVRTGPTGTNVNDLRLVLVT